VAGRAQLLGQASIELEGCWAPFAAKRPYQLLAFLAYSRDWIERERIALLFWPELDSEAAHRNVRKLIHRAREETGVDSIELRGSHVRWVVDSDLLEFDARLTAGDYRAALNLYRGPLLDGLERTSPTAYEVWLRAERALRARQHRDAALKLLHASNDPSTRLDLARNLLSIDGLDEDAQAAAVEALLELGKRLDAVALMQSYAARLADELGVEPSARLRALLAPVTPATAAPRAARKDTFVGRNLEVRQIVKALTEGTTRALLLHGPGGIGKSRLAQRAMAEMAVRLSGGAYWVALEDLTDASQVPARAARAAQLDPREETDAVAALARQIADRELLLIFDNAEHLTGVGVLLAALKKACPRLCLLVTSRVPLDGLDAETLTLQGLEVPDDESLDPDAAWSFDAMTLFAQQAALHNPAFVPEAHLDAVIDIVRQVQGLPLAIEMAAAWTRLLPPVEIAAELSRSIDLLERDTHDAASGRPEHASIRIVLERSWALLAPMERAAMAALGVFVGGFTRDAAQSVALLPLPLLASLVDKCLVQADRERGRFGLHPLVAAYAREQAAADPVREAEVLDRHCAYFAGWLQRANASARTDAAGFKRLVDAEFENCRKAWHYAVVSGAAEPVAKLAGGLSNYLENCGRYSEGEELLSAALVLDDAQPNGARAMAQTCRGLATLQYRAGRLERVERTARRGVRAARLGGDGPALKACLNQLGLVHWQRNNFAEALPYYEAALKQAEGDGDRYGVAVFSGNMALIARELGRFDKSLALQTTAYEVNRELGNLRGQAINLNNLGNHYRLFAHWDLARQHFLDGLALVDLQGMAGLRSSFVVNLGLVDLECGAFDEAERRLQETLALRDRGAEPYLINAALLGLARMATRRKDLSGAYRWLSTALREARAMGGTFHFGQELVVLAELMLAEGRSGEARSVLAGVLSDRRTDATVRIEAERLQAAAGTPVGDVSALSSGELDRALERVLEQFPHAPEPPARNIAAS
jgi:predicted ATPase/DNA-binding SARP family transcriptional activator